MKCSPIYSDSSSGWTISRLDVCMIYHKCRSVVKEPPWRCTLHAQPTREWMICKCFIFIYERTLMFVVCTHNVLWLATCMFPQVVVFQYSFWLSLFLLFFTAASRVSLFGVLYLLLCFFFLYRGQEMLKDRQHNRHRRSVAFLKYSTTVPGSPCMFIIN